MRQQHPPAGTLFLVCTNCDRGEWIKLGSAPGEYSHYPKPSRGALESRYLPLCRHCGAPTEERKPLILALTQEDFHLLKLAAEWTRGKRDDTAIAALRRYFRQLATERAGQGKPIPQTAAEWLQNNPEK